MASVAPFSRRQWASQSLRVTAKELSIVSARGKNNAIAERFSKYQLAAEEGNAERKKTVVDPLPSSLRSGNLSDLKKRWEQQQQPPSLRTEPQASSCSSNNLQNHIDLSAGAKPTAASQIKNISDPTTQSENQIPCETSRSAQDLSDMEAKPSRESEVQEGTGSAEVPDCEKPSVPLNSLKMMFERGENLENQVSPAHLLCPPPPPHLINHPCCPPSAPHPFSPSTMFSLTHQQMPPFILPPFILPPLCLPSFVPPSSSLLFPFILPPLSTFLPHSVLPPSIFPSSSFLSPSTLSFLLPPSILLPSSLILPPFTLQPPFILHLPSILPPSVCPPSSLHPFSLRFSFFLPPYSLYPVSFLPSSFYLPSILTSSSLHLSFFLPPFILLLSPLLPPSIFSPSFLLPAFILPSSLHPHFFLPSSSFHPHSFLP
uniref:Uncharacterized protein n=1 Tax=Acanthochromis polyacanthus TaxID=80966 RepID=A0A3Q1EWH4_9TELE